MAKGFILSEKDKATLQRLLYWWEQQEVNTTNRPGDYLDREELSRADIFVGKAPSGGIPALSGLVPGSAQIDLYKLISGSLHPTGMSKQKVHNLSSNAITGDSWVEAKRDKFGTWVATPTAVGGSAESQWKSPACRVATTVAGTLATSYEAGDIVDGVTLVAGDRILIKNLSSQAFNGIYVVQASGTPTRATDADTIEKLENAVVSVSEGSVNGDTIWMCPVNAPGTGIDADTITWTRIHPPAEISWKQPCKAATTGNVTLSTALENGDTLDGVALVTGDRVLVKNQSIAADNGIYIVQASGTPIRSVDTETTSLRSGAVTVVLGGLLGANTMWQCDSIGNNWFLQPNISSARREMAGSTAHLLDTYDWEDINDGATLDITLPTPGTYLVFGHVQTGMDDWDDHGELGIRLYNVTDSAPVEPTFAYGIVSYDSGPTPKTAMGTGHIMHIMTVTAAKTLRLQGMFTESSGSSTYNGTGYVIPVCPGFISATNCTHIGWVRLAGN
jgi:hypothetical protein